MLFNKQIQLYISIFSLLISFQHSYSIEKNDQKKHSQLYLSKGVAIYNQKIEFSDTALSYILKRYDYYITKKDTNLAILHLLEASDIERFSGNYEDSFEKLWEAAGLLKNQTNNPLSIRINRNLGILYDIFNKDLLTKQHHQKSLLLAKHFAERHMVDSAEILHCYFSIATFYRGNGEYEMALKYLDSCQYLFGPDKHLPYVDADKGVIHLKMGNIEKATRQLYKVKPFFLKNQNRYWSVVASFIGDLKADLHETDSAIYYYTEALNAVNKYNVHLEYKPELLKKLSELHFNKGNYAYAYKLLDDSRNSMDVLFNITYKRNSKLFEIKNTYQEKLEQNEVLIQKQTETIYKKNRVLKLLIISISALAILGFLIAFIVRQRLKIRQLQANRMFAKEKTDAILKHKSKELTTYALQMVEKEKSVQELLKIIKEDNPQQYKTLSKQHLSQSKKLWDNFNSRFLEVNNDFYKKLIDKHPDLTPTEQKHCALIRMKFDNNELTQILNISLQAVHTSRYRIRKKIGLERNDSLSDYIAEL